MRVPTIRGVALFGMLVTTVFLPGCGQSDGRIPVNKTTGKLVWAGRPVLGLLVVLHPVDTSAPATPVQPTGVVQEDGTFAITCYNTSDGAPPGEYVVTIREAPRPDGSTKLKMPASKYRDPRLSPLRARVEKKSLNELDPLVLTD